MMRFIHMADVHLGVIPDKGRPWAERRKQEIWDSFRQVIACARGEGVDLLLIAGDLFHGQPLKRELKEVSALFESIPDTEVVLIAGNHDYLHPRSYYHSFPWPTNVHLLKSENPEGLWLEGPRTMVWGASYWASEDGRRMYDNMPTGFPARAGGMDRLSSKEQEQAEFHILLGHGGDDRHRPFGAQRLAEQGWDYAAFGHIHKAAQLVPNRVVMAGALEPTDCNDFGPHGFWIGELTALGDGAVIGAAQGDVGSRCQVHFVPIKNCQYISQDIMVHGRMTEHQILQAVEAALRDREPYQISHVRLSGYRDGDVEIDRDAILRMDRVVRVVDDTVPDYDFEKLRQQHEGHLLGQFIDTLWQSSDQPRARKALYYGVWAMLESEKIKYER